jgi:hypothetical protein
MTLQNSQSPLIEGATGSFQPAHTSELQKMNAYDNPNVLYFDASTLKNKLSVSETVKLLSYGFIFAAILIGCGILYFYYQGVLKQPEISTEAISALESPAAIELPSVDDIYGKTSDEIIAALAQSGATVVEKPSASSDSTTLIKLPDGMTDTDVLSMYALGIGSLSEDELAKVLNGSYTITTTTGDNPSQVIRYADFTSGTTEQAILAAMASEGFDQSSVDDSGTDSSGNTYKTGKATIDGVERRWRVSVIALSEMYSAAQNLPYTALYVGLRIS